MDGLTCGSLFSGIGGIDLAFQQAGFTIAYQVEIDPYCQQVLAKHWPEVQRYGDIFGIDTLPPVDVMAGGFPCQPVSHAGRRKGEQDERWLWPEFYRLIAQGKPRVVFLENVPGLRTIEGGNTFKHVVGQLAEIGYTVQWSHCRAADIGAPHKRERVFIVAYGDGQRESQLQGSIANIARRADDRNPKMGNTSRPRLERRQGLRSHLRAQQSPAQRAGNGMADTAHQRVNRWQRLQTNDDRCRGERLFRANKGDDERNQAQSRLGRVAHGLPYRLDRHQFPAPPGEQYAWEPPRTTTQTENRANRLKALGNAVVPQVVYPIALAIYEWLIQSA